LTKIVLKKETSAIFLAIVLVLGTIALTVPSFSVETQATSDRERDYDYDDKSRYYDEHDYDSYDKKSYRDDDYGKEYPSYKPVYNSYGKYDDRNYDKSKHSSSVFVKKVKCNNINVNVNGVALDINDFPRGLFGADAATEVEASVSDNGIDGSSSNGPSGFDNGGFIFKCINNNNNIVTGAEEEPTSPTPPRDPCEDCFINNLNSTELSSLERFLESTPQEDIEGLCDFLSDPATPNTEKRLILSRIAATADIDFASLEAINNCLVGLGLLPPS
jgi:hypothetical protein